ncbi:MAG: sulfate adenylyltransferase subunit CysD [Candidatus Omnitrophica bacterium]|jgi:sulfate adenylyltransferase subunit 2|nr:sulfate adenylyltransferase subunit CysD [Candidatus Omnitrophota bacterium]MDD3274702.1 sulfate adenylyltransferase subunit CysD [Candidatus Omnitrophota bacterium]MDD5077972.1 sulfate adenylyltransferase subunit CysD [Candidatus Omnitrophota bacterium]
MTKENGAAYLKERETKSIYIIREAYYRYRDKLALLWSMGKDSTALLHLSQKAFFGRIPFPVIHIDTSFKFKQIYSFRDRLTKEYGINLIIARNEPALKKHICPEQGRYRCCQALKTQALKIVTKKYGLKAFLVAIRRDEHLIRAKERVFSARDENFRWNWQNPSLEMWSEYSEANPGVSGHLRVHPLLDWREIDVWRYTKAERIPILDLYFAKNGRRYRSVGCQSCCQAIPSTASDIGKIIAELGKTKIAERSGRCQDKEKAYMMQKLRSLGYM